MIKSSELFNENFDNPSKTYCQVRDSKDISEVRARALSEKLWITFKPYADPNFLEQLTKDFDARFWEMDLAVNLLKNGFLLDARSGSFGPDVCVKSSPKIWIEAIAVKSGIGPDKVPERAFGKNESQESYDQQTLLRYTSAIKTKFVDKLEPYFSSGLIADDEPYVVAINGSQLPGVRQDSEVPRIVRSVFPLGDEVLKFNKSDNTLHSSFEFSPNATKASGEEISTSIFLNKAYSKVSALIFSYADCCNRPKGENDWIVIHNPLAANPIEFGSLPCAEEYWVTSVDNEYTLHCRTST